MSPEPAPTRASAAQAPPHSDSIILESNNISTSSLLPNCSESASASPFNGSNPQASESSEKNDGGPLLLDMGTPGEETEWVEDVGAEANKDLADIAMGESGSPKEGQEIKATVHGKTNEGNEGIEAGSAKKDEDTVMS